MRVSVDRLRRWLLVGAALLVLVVGGFLGYARYRTHRFLAGLPSKLGVDIRRETNGYTYSQSVKGKTVMTLHAAKAVEHTDGKLTLHDVGIVLYGRTQDRMDRISGAEFEYDQASAVIRAKGEVHIDLEAAAQAGKPVVTKPVGMEGGRIVHVTTSGLVYLQKLGVAATDQEVDFRFGAMTGHAMGAEYNSDTGVLVLQSAVKAEGLQRDRPSVLTATHAEMDRQKNVSVLMGARYVSPGRTLLADVATVHQRTDGSPERIEAEGHVRLEGAGKGAMSAPHGDVLLAATGKAQAAHLFGGVTYTDAETQREGNGQAQDARVAFNAAGEAEHVYLVGAVHVMERVRAGANGGWSTRESTSGRMTLALRGDGSGKRTELSEAEAMDAARVVIVNDVGMASETRTEMAGDTLTGQFVRVGGKDQLSAMHGVGRTSLRRVGLQGAEQTSMGDVLDAVLRPGASGGEKGEVERATQAGHVVLTSLAARRAAASTVGTPVASRAVAELAEYDGDTDALTLTGHAQVVDAGSTLWANKIVMEHASGDATATGMVKANYLQPNATEAVHVLAERAVLTHATGRAVFYGAGVGAGGGKTARLWQGASQVEAPVIEMEQQQRRLTARGEDGSAAAAPVHAVLVSAGGGAGGAKKAGASGASGASVVRIESRVMVYQDAARQVDFSGGVKVVDGDGLMRAREATAYLQQARPVGEAGAATGAAKAAAKGGDAGAFFGGSVERIVAVGGIEMDQPGRRALGERLVYTASDSLFVLTGTKAALPKLIDEVQGTVTGSALSFHTGDDSVVVTGGGAESPGQKVHTVTRVKQK